MSAHEAHEHRECVPIADIIGHGVAIFTEYGSSEDIEEIKLLEAIPDVARE